MEKKYLAGILALAVCAVMASSVYAFAGGFGLGFQGNKGFGIGSQGNEAVKQAIESGGYAAFVDAISKQVTEEQFQQMVQQNKTTQAIEQALEAKDYDAWVQAIESMPRITDIITKENFPQYVAFQEAMKNKDLETAKALEEELGLDQLYPQGQFQGKGFGMRGGMNHLGPGFIPQDNSKATASE
jgi:hypothetical protein